MVRGILFDIMVFPSSAKILLGACVALALFLAYGGYRFYGLSTAHDALIATSSARIAELEAALLDANQTNEDLAYSLAAEKTRNDAFYDQINEITGTVGKLDKLSKTDRELLQKYSKVYFLNENYVPDGLTQVDPEWVSPPDKVIEIHRHVWPYLEKLLHDAEEDGVMLRIVSGFRSFGTQAGLKASYSVQFGSGANAFSADQGYSEHQLGTAVDFTTDAIGGGLAGFETTEAYAWLLDNAYRYGFILSYPKDNSYYVYEPWHWRFVGKELARDLRSDEKFFYDLDQRDIDEYLINIFD